MKAPIHFTIIDDHSLVREGIQALLMAGIPDSLVKSYPEIPPMDEVLTAPPDMIICDYRVGGSNALDFLIALAGRSPTPPVLIISMLDELEVGPQCIRAGAKGFVSKSSPSEEILNASRMILAGNTYLSCKLAHALLKPVNRKHPQALNPSPNRSPNGSFKYFHHWEKVSQSAPSPSAAGSA
jgi:DNA-binding NarL/FixJ family response regulator